MLNVGFIYMMGMGKSSVFWTICDTWSLVEMWHIRYIFGRTRSIAQGLKNRRGTIA